MPPPPQAMLGRLQSYDLFRHVPKDLTEATRIGGAVSICAVFAILTLCLMARASLLRPGAPHDPPIDQ